MIGVPFVEKNYPQLVVNWLAVAGGAVIAGLLVGWLTQLLARTATKRRVPRPALNGIRALGAVAGGILVYLFVFGSGGPGYGLGGGGWGLGLGGGGKAGQSGTAATGTTQPTRSTTPTVAGPRSADRIVRIEMLGGKRYPGGERFYLVGDDKEPRTLFEVRQAIEERLRRQPPVQEVEIVIRPEGSVAREHPAVNRLVELAHDLGLGVKVSTPGSEAS